jgi:hypothetical protein
VRKLLTLAAATTMLAAILVSPVSAATTAGTWVQYPNGAPVYFAEVQQPINSANTSNWSSKSKGGIPVMYKLSSGVGPAVFESIYSDNATDATTGSPCATGHANDCAFESFTPSSTLLFNDITVLKTDYSWLVGDCHGGSLRWSVRTSATQSVFIYYGSVPQFGGGGVDGCNPSLGGVNQSGVNMIGMSDLRYDTTQYPGGTFYDTYAHAQELVGTSPVIRVSLVLDGGWGGDQRLSVSNATVNDNVYQWNQGGNGTLSPTCNLPDAFIDVTRVSPTPDGAINETTVYPQSATNTDDQFRVVDCKYQYVLSIQSLSGPGTYDVEIVIEGNAVTTSASSNPPSEVRFDLK